MKSLSRSALVLPLESILHMACPKWLRASPASGKFENHAAMVAIHAVYYNFARIHKTLRITPAMAAGLSDHVWTVEEIILMADSYMPTPAKRGPYKRPAA